MKKKLKSLVILITLIVIIINCFWSFSMIIENGNIFGSTLIYAFVFFFVGFSIVVSIYVNFVFYLTYLLNNQYKDDIQNDKDNFNNGKEFKLKKTEVLRKCFKKNQEK